MKKSDLLKALWQVVVGKRITVRGERHQITEVVEYEEDDDTWLNLVWPNKAGLEFALEVEGNKLTLWEETRDIADVDVGIVNNPKIIKYLGEEYRLKENGAARTVSKTKIKETLRYKTPYWVYKAKSGHKLAVEIWDDGVHFYYADGELSAKDVWV